MKHKTLIILGAAVALTSSAFGQACTDPVGYVTCDVSAQGSKNSFIAPTLVNKPEYTGMVTAKSGNILTLDSAAFTAGMMNMNADGTYAYYVDGMGGAADGYWDHIASNAAGTVTCSGTNTLVSMLSVGDTVIIRKHVTISDYFGANNEAGLVAGTDTTVADTISIVDPTAGANESYFYSTLGGLAGWRDPSYLSAANKPIYPNLGVQIKTVATANKAFTFAGHVKVNQTRIPIYNSVNVIPIVAPVGVTLGNSALNAALTQGADTTTADVVQIPGPFSSDSYFISSLTGLTGWRDTSYTDASGVSLSEGASIVVNKASAGTSYWMAPAPIIGN